jgi:hypothetical protein
MSRDPWPILAVFARVRLGVLCHEDKATCPFTCSDLPASGLQAKRLRSTVGCHFYQ